MIRTLEDAVQENQRLRSQLELTVMENRQLKEELKEKRERYLEMMLLYTTIRNEYDYLANMVEGFGVFYPMEPRQWIDFAEKLAEYKIEKFKEIKSPQWDALWEGE